MQEKKHKICTIELKVQKHIVKLSLFSSDSLQDLLLRLSDKLKLHQKYSENVKEKLQEGLRKIVKNSSCSEKLRQKLEQLTQQSKIVILSITQNAPPQQSLNQTPFNILKASQGSFRKPSVEQSKRNYLKQNEETPILKRNYNMPASQIIHQRYDTDNPESCHKHHRFKTISGIIYNNSFKGYAQSAQNHLKQQERYQRDQIRQKNHTHLAVIMSKRSIEDNLSNQIQLKRTFEATTPNLTNSLHPQSHIYSTITKKNSLNNNQTPLKHPKQAAMRLQVPNKINKSIISNKKYSYLFELEQ